MPPDPKAFVCLHLSHLLIVKAGSFHKHPAISTKIKETQGVQAFVNQQNLLWRIVLDYINHNKMMSKRLQTEQNLTTKVFRHKAKVLLETSQKI